MLARTALALAVAWLAVAAATFTFQRSLLFRPDRERVAPKAVGLDGFAEETLATPDGERLVVWWAPPKAGRLTVLYLHGNGGNLSYRAGRYGRLRDAGFGVLALSWRGYGGSTGSPDERSLLADARLALGYLRSRGVDGARTVLFGESLGTGVAVQVAAGERVAGVVLDSPYTSLPDVAAARFWFLPVHALMWDRLDSMAHIADVRAPLLIVHGDRDLVVPFELGRRLFEAAREPKRHATITDGGHTVPFARGGWEPVQRFLVALEQDPHAR